MSTFDEIVKMFDKHDIADPNEMLTRLVVPLLDRFKLEIDHILGVIHRAIESNNPDELHEVEDHWSVFFQGSHLFSTTLSSMHYMIGPCSICGLPEPLPGTSFRLPSSDNMALEYPLDCPVCGLYVSCVDVIDNDVIDDDWLLDTRWPVISNNKMNYYARPCGHVLPANADGEYCKVKMK